jgi:catechol 2,3-dioxygenase-like lactoylglutathione lyase family enzyme
MKVIPLLRCPHLKEAIHFYTTVLDFQLKYSEEADNEWGVDLVNGDAELMIVSNDGPPRTVVYISVENVDVVFRKYIDRGLVLPNDPNSPVHNSPIDQTWGLREFYINDPGGNTLRFASPIK